MEGNSCSESREFKFQHHGYYSNSFVVNIIMFVSKRQTINEKESGDGPFFEKFICTCEKDSN